VTTKKIIDKYWKDIVLVLLFLAAWLAGQKP